MKLSIPTAVIVVFTAGMLLGWEIGLAARPGPPLVPVVVARQDIPAGTPILNPRRWFTTKLFQPGTAPPDSYTCPEDIPSFRCIGRGLWAGQPCTPRDLSINGVVWGPGPPGFRVVTIRVSALDVLSPCVDVGSYVDLVLTTFDPVTEAREATVFLERVKVLAVNRIRDSQPNLQIPGGGAVVRPGVVTLAAKTRDAVRIIRAKDQGNIYLMVRHPDDESILNLPSMSDWQPVAAGSDR